MGAEQVFIHAAIAADRVRFDRRQEPCKQLRHLFPFAERCPQTQLPCKTPARAVAAALNKGRFAGVCRLRIVFYIDHAARKQRVQVRHMTVMQLGRRVRFVPFDNFSIRADRNRLHARQNRPDPCFQLRIAGIDMRSCLQNIAKQTVYKAVCHSACARDGAFFAVFIVKRVFRRRGRANRKPVIQTDAAQLM